MGLFSKDNLILCVVFITGACVLIVEVVAMRVLAPFFGNTAFTVSSVLSVILAALSVGYYYGGKLADRRPATELFYTIIFFSGLSLLALQFIGTLILPIFAYSFSIVSGPLAASLILFFLPALLLGTLSPFAIKLQSVQTPAEGVGSVAGKIFFWSTLGSIFGSLASGFFLIPRFGVNQIFIGTGVVLFLIGIIPILILKQRRLRVGKVFFLFVILLSVSLATLIPTASGNLVYEENGIYQTIKVLDSVQQDRPTRVLRLDRSQAGGMFLDNGEPLFRFVNYFAFYKVFNPDIRNALVLGGGAYLVPKALLAALPGVYVDVSEIEPSLIDVAKNYFGLQESTRIRNSTDDGRRFLHDSKTSYDLIFSDVYQSLYSIPAHFTTKEFFELAYNKLAADGFFVANVIGALSRQSPSFLLSEAKTFREVFPNSYFFAVTSKTRIYPQNIIFVGLKNNKKYDFTSAEFRDSQDPFISALPDQVVDMERFELSPNEILTDNYAPVEYLTSRLLFKTYIQTSTVGIEGQEMMAVLKQQFRYDLLAQNSSSRGAMEAFIRAETEALFSAKPQVQEWSYRDAKGLPRMGLNILGSFLPEEKRRVVLATHHSGNDVDVTDDARRVSAGVPVLLEIARLVREGQLKLHVGLDLMFLDGAMSGESRGSDGANAYSVGSRFIASQFDELYHGVEFLPGEVMNLACSLENEVLPMGGLASNPALTSAGQQSMKRCSPNEFERVTNLLIQKLITNNAASFEVH